MTDGCRVRLRWWMVLVLATVLLLAGTPARADRVLALGNDPVAAADHLSVLIDPTGRLDIDEVAGERWRDAFVPVAGNVRAGYTSATAWVRLTVRPAITATWWLAAAQPFVDSVALFVPDGQGGWRLHEGGDTRPLAEAAVPYRLPVFPLALAGGQETTLYLRLRSASTLSAEPVFYPPERFAHAAAGHALFAGGILAIYLIITLNIIYYTRLRDVLYASYCGWMASNGISFFAIFGYAREFLFPAGGWIPTWVVETSIVVALPVGSVFISRLLYLRRNHPWFARFYALATWVGVGCLLATLAGYFPQVALLVNWVGVLLGLLAVGLSARLAMRGFRPAWLYALAFTAHPFGLVVVTLRNAGLIEPGLLADHVYVIASLLNAVILAVGLLDRLNMDARVTLEAKQTALDAALRHERELETRIAVQSRALAEASAALSEAEVGRRRTEQALQKSEALFETLITAAPVPLLVAIPARGAIVFANERAAALLGRPVAEILGQLSLDRLLPASDLSRLDGALRIQEIVQDLETRILTGHAAPLWGALSAARIAFKGEDALMVGINDITTRRKLEFALLTARNQAEESLALERVRMQEQRQLISTTAHEFKTPLAMIDRAAQMLQFDVEAAAGQDERTAKRLDTVRDAVRRLRRVVDSFLADAALEAGRLPVEMRPTPVAPLLKRALALLDAREPPRTARLRLSGDDLVCEADGRLLSIVLDNILDNACKYSPPDSTIELEARLDGPDLLLSVTDHGIGVPAEELELVGSRFFRATNATGTPGTGLGLSTARQLIGLQNGTIVLHSRQGAGTTVTIRLGRGIQP